MDFITWARAAERSQEELITLERLTEVAVPLWRQKHGVRVEDYLGAGEAERERRHQRVNNPAYFPKLLGVTLERTQEMLGEIRELKLGGHGERVVRAVSPLRWLPELESLHLGATELADAEALGELPRLRRLQLSDAVLDDVAAIGRCGELRELELGLTRPWPVLGALAKLVKLERVSFYGNALALEEVAGWPLVRVARFHSSGGPLRDLRRLPAMPLVEGLAVQPVFGLAGMEQFPLVRNLELSGPMEDLRPLGELKRLTFAEMKGDGFRDVSPLVGLPELRSLMFYAQRPRDYSMLSGAPRLHEVVVRGCTVNEMELGVLHAMLEPWEAECLLEKPRGVTGIRPMYYPWGNMECDGWWPIIDEATWDGDAQMEAAEQRWFSRWVGEAVEGFFSKRLDAEKAENFRMGTVSREARVELKEFEQVDLLWELVPLLQNMLVRTRWRHAIYVSCYITVKEALGQTEEGYTRTEADEDRRESWRAAERAKQEQLDREHRFELLKAEGAEIAPEDFAAPPLDEDRVLVPAGMEGETPHKPWQPKDFNLDEEAPFDPEAWRFDGDLAEWDFALFFSLLVTEEVCLVENHHARTAEYYLRRKAEKRQSRGGG